MAGFDLNQGLMGAATYGGAGFSMGGPWGALAAIPGGIYSGFANAAKSPYDDMMDAKNPMYKQIGQSVYEGAMKAGRNTAEDAKKRMFQQGFGGQFAGAGYQKNIQDSQRNAYDAGQNAIFNAVDNNFGKYTQGKAQEQETKASFGENLAKSAISAAMFAYMKQGNNGDNGLAKMGGQDRVGTTVPGSNAGMNGLLQYGMPDWMQSWYDPNSIMNQTNFGG